MPLSTTTVKPDVAATALYLSKLKELSTDNSLSSRLTRNLRNIKRRFQGATPSEESRVLLRLSKSKAICAAFDDTGFRGSGFGPDRDYAPNPDGPRTLDEAIEIAQQAGVVFDPEDYSFQVLPDEKFDELHGAGKFAVYGPQGLTPAAKRMRWRDLCSPEGRMCVRIREAVLESDQMIVAIFAHECFEVEALREKLSERRTISAAELHSLTAEGVKNNLHWMAWREANTLVQKTFGE